MCVGFHGTRTVKTPTVKPQRKHSNDIVFDIHAMVAPGLVGMVICRYCWARFEYCANVDVPRASTTELLMAASAGRWFMYLSLGLSTSHARCARVGVVVLVCKEVYY